MPSPGLGVDESGRSRPASLQILYLSGETMRSKSCHLVLTLVLCLVVAACGDDGSTGPGGDDPVETGLADLEADAIVRLVIVDNSFGPESDPFEIVNVGTLIGGDADRPLEPRAHDLAAAALGGSAAVVFVDDVEGLIDDLFEQNTIGAAVASVEDLRIDGGRAELDMRLWCGSLCGVFLTYEAVLTDTGWDILGTTGPVAMS